MSRLFYDDEFTALRAVIEEGKDYKKSAEHLWPSMKPASAYAKLKACTSGTGDERLKFGEIIALCNFNQRFDALFFMCDETLHTRPTQKSPVDEQARLAVVIEQAATTMESAMRTLTALRRTG